MKRALIVTDIQDDFLGNTQDYIVQLAQKYLSERGKDYDLIILTRWVHADIEGRDTLLLSHPDARVVDKRTYSAYNDEVKQLLTEKDIEEVHLAGVDAEMTILATMYSLLDGGYEVKLLERLIASYHCRNWEALTVARHVIGDENVLFVGGGRVWV